MKKFIILLIVIFISLTSFSQGLSIIKIETLEKRIKNNSDTTYIVNFWATWCAPCVKELPYFDSINNTYLNSKVKVILVSMDFKENLMTKLIPFIAAKKLRSEVVLLDELNGNYFIPMISDQWTGAIPATLIINNKKKINHFFEKKVDYKLLETELESVLTK